MITAPPSGGAYFLPVLYYLKSPLLVSFKTIYGLYMGFWAS